MQRRIFCSVVVSMLALRAVAQDPIPRAPRDRTTDAITHTLGQFVDAWNKHDAHAFALTFTEDADFTNVQGVHAKGRANVESFHALSFAGVFKDSHLSANIRSVRMLTPGLAAVDIEWQMTGARAPDGSERPNRMGLLDWIMAKRSGGKWLIEVMHNTDLNKALPAGAAK